MAEWKPGDRLRHRFNAELGPGRVVALEGRSVVVEFPDAGTTLRLAASTDALARLDFPPGSHVRRAGSSEAVRVLEAAGPGSVRLSDGSEVATEELWPVAAGDSAIDLLAEGQVGTVEAFSLRLDALHLAALREAGDFGSFLGGRIELFPHQLHVARKATRPDPVRWLLADEVGLGKTVEACLIVNHLIHARRAARVLVVTPETLSVQWLGELWRKYHQVFVLLDGARLADVERDFGRDFNPFDVHRRVVVGLDTLVARPRLTEAAVAAGIDVLVVDEAHHLKRAPGHPGNPAYRAIAPIAALGKHVLLLTATPLEEDAHGFLRLLQLLRPDELPESLDFDERLRRGDPLPACASCTRRADIGGLPPRVAEPIDFAAEDAGSAAQAALVEALLALPAENPVARREKAERIRRALASGASALAALGAAGGPLEPLRTLARRALAEDPRIDWLAAKAPGWKQRGQKTLVFTAERETLEAIQTALSRKAQIRCGVFHEDLSPAQRDIEVAQFRLSSGPSILVSTECGGEGRNFQFCNRLVLFDLPWNPQTVEQRIGRLDRIGRKRPVKIVFFRPPAGLGRVVADLYESLGIFREPMGGIDRELAGIEDAITEAALEKHGAASAGRFEATLAEVRAAQHRSREAVYRELIREPYRPEMAREILASIPEGFEELTQDVVLAACEAFGFHVEEQRGRSRYSVEFGNRARIDSLPGVPPGTSFLGTFDREEGVEDESIDFFSSGHPLVEGVLAGLEDGPLGRTAVLTVESEGERGIGLGLLYAQRGAVRAAAIDSEGRFRPEWAEAFSRRPLRTKRVSATAFTQDAGWPDWVRSLSAQLDADIRPIAAVLLVVAPAERKAR